MKHLIAILFMFTIAPLWGYSQKSTTPDSTGLPGDHFSLEGALEMLRNAVDLEAFEKALNTEANGVNNLDLNQDGDVDYVLVEHRSDGEAHAIVLRAVVSASESQDLAMIGIEKNGAESAVLQIIGDQEVYGDDWIVEPLDEKAVGGKGGPAAPSEMVGVVVNVWSWSCVRNVYGSGNHYWISPFEWGYYPFWRKAWRARLWRAHQSQCFLFQPGYGIVLTNRVHRSQTIYSPFRRTSPHVRTHYKQVHAEHHIATSGKKNDAERTGPSTGKGTVQNNVVKTKKSPTQLVDSGNEVRSKKSSVTKKKVEASKAKARK